MDNKNSTGPVPRSDAWGARIDFRVSPAVARRVDALAAYAGCTRSEWMRLAIAYVDSETVLAELDRLEQQAGGLSDDQERIRSEAIITLGEISAALSPKPIIAMNPN